MGCSYRSSISHGILETLWATSVNMLGYVSTNLPWNVPTVKFWFNGVFDYDGVMYGTDDLWVHDEAI